MRKVKNENKRSKIDIILTDLQPVETPEIYTMQFFYDYLVKNKSIDRISKKKYDSEKGVTCSQWHAAPLKYHTLKDNYEYREMSYINMLSMIEVCLFLEKYENVLLDYVSKDSFSLRTHRRRKNLVFKQVNEKVVEYGYLNKNIEKEATGDYYEIYPYCRLDFFYKSPEWFDLNRRYKYFGKLDYSKCFDSIYTHTFNWIIADNTIDAKNFNKKHFLSAIDRLLQNMNMSITNGIVVGPEFSRLVSEIILQSIDREVIDIMEINGFIKGEDYEVKRYVDDIFIFAVNEEIVQRIVEITSSVAEKFRLRINYEKKVIGKLPYIWSQWITRINDFQYVFIDYFFYYLLDTSHSYLLKERNIISLSKIAKIKEMFQNAIISDEKMNVKIVSYCLSTIFNKLKLQKNNEIKKTIFNTGSVRVIYQLYDLIIYIYSFAQTYNNTEKLISIIHTIEKEIGEQKSNIVLKKIIKAYDYIFYNGNFADITNLLLLCILKKIEIGTKAEKKCKEYLKKDSNPMQYAIFLLYEEKLNVDNKIIKNEIEKKIDYKIEIMKSIKDKIFMKTDIWWVYIFYDCPFLSTHIKNKMNVFLTELKTCIRDEYIWGAAKIEILNFYLDTSVKQKIMNWNIDEDTLYKNIVFKTFERTIFNNSSQNDVDTLYNY